MLDLDFGATVRCKWLGAAALGVVATLGACVIDAGAPPATELYRLIDAHCGQADACACVWAQPDAEACTTELEARWKARLGEAQDRGLRYDAECFAALVDQIETRRCFWPGGDAPLCESFCAPFHGEKTEGQGCTGDDVLVSDCAQGLVCSQGECVSPCAALSGRLAGEPCGNELAFGYDDCAQGLVCGFDGVCAEPPGEGEECLSGECGEGFYCAWDTYVCVRGAGVGEPCIDRPCEDELFCDWQTNTCRALSGEGESCYDYPCADGLDCYYVGPNEATCLRRAAEGESCSQRSCVEGLWCSESSICVTAPVAGQPCLYGSICEEGSVCDATAQCVAPPEEGQPCVSGTCARRSWCDFAADPTGVGLCTALQANDEECSGHRQCQSGYCPNGFCWPMPLDGESCEGTGLCGGGLVCNGTTCEPTLTRAPAACSYPGW